MKDLQKLFESADWYLEMFLKFPKKVQQLLLMSNIENDIFTDIFTDTNIESPIEQIFITAFQLYCKFQNKKEFFLFSQREIEANGKKYIADFVFEADIYVNPYFVVKPLVIECDGYEFHQKTKEQVMKDNEREFNLKMAGYDVIRFSGSQIYRNPLKCAEDTYQYIQSLIKGE